MNIKATLARLKRIEKAAKLGNADALLRKMSDEHLKALVAGLEAAMDIEDDDEATEVAIEVIVDHAAISGARAAALWNGYAATVDRQLERLSDEDLVALIETTQDQIAAIVA